MDIAIVFGGVAGDDRQVKSAVDRFLRLALEQELERLPHHLFRQDLAASELFVVAGLERDEMGSPATAFGDRDAICIAALLQNLDCGRPARTFPAGIPNKGMEAWVARRGREGSSGGLGGPTLAAPHQLQRRLRSSFSRLKNGFVLGLFLVAFFCFQQLIGFVRSKKIAFRPPQPQP